MKDLGEVMTPAVLGIVSHELRTPLAAIKGFTSLLLRHDGQLTAQERVEMLREIDMAGDRLNNVIEHLLILAELSTDAPQLAMQPVDIFLLVQDVLRQAEQRAQMVGDPPITFTLNRPDTLPDEDPLLASGDPHYLRLLLEELLENARKFSSQGGAITVTLRLPVDQAPFESM
ncbi:MAG TPA: histidine kinase dimerization/phospho-acceptor domain-containing protein, partial [Ktedonobacterales bacterium]|nr:histidine kinase dimerization/phospho-acceptor domain-containing protein [Ktedonobacterales bacterium]